MMMSLRLSVRASGAADGGGAASSGRSGAPLWDCLREHDAELTRSYEPELLGEWPLDADRRNLDSAAALLGHCSEMMLFPPGALTKGATYAEELEKWTALFPKASLKVTA